MRPFSFNTWVPGNRGACQPVLDQRFQYLQKFANLCLRFVSGLVKRVFDDESLAVLPGVGLSRPVFREVEWGSTGRGALAV